MAIYGPNAGIPKEDVFDHIVDNMVASGSWSILHDKRAQSRVGTADGFQAISRKSLAEVNTSLTTGPAPSTADSPIRLQTVLRNNSSIHLYYANSVKGNASAGANVVISENGVLFGTPDSYSPFNKLGFAITHDRMTPDNRYWIYTIDANATVHCNATNDPPVGAQFGTNSAIRAAVVGDTGIASPKLAVLKESGTDVVVAFPLESYGTEKIEFIRVTGSYNNGGIAAPVLGSISAPALGVASIHGVDYMIDTGSVIEIYISVVGVGGDLKTIRAIQSDPTWAIFNITVPSLDRVYPVGTLGETAFSAPLLDANGNVESIYISEFEGDTVVAGNRTDVVVRNLVEGVDSNPDFNGLQYEYVIMESTFMFNSGDGYKLFIGQPNEDQVGAPTVTGITDTLPIFMRPIRGGEVSPNAMTRFFLEPKIPVGIIAGTNDAIGPALFAIPNTAAPVEETHNIWMRVDDQQVFIFSESTDGIGQMLHANICAPILPLDTPTDSGERNDNIMVMSAGVPEATATIYLGRNGQNEGTTFDVRLNNEPYYPLASELTYSTGLADVNAVDSKDYLFNIFVGSNSASLESVGATSGEFIVGSMHDTFYLPNDSAQVTGNLVTINATSYKYFKASDSSASNQSNMTQPAVVVKWD